VLAVQGEPVGKSFALHVWLALHCAGDEHAAHVVPPEPHAEFAVPLTH
jgi:hypothetical protein